MVQRRASLAGHATHLQLSDPLAQFDFLYLPGRSFLGKIGDLGLFSARSTHGKIRYDGDPLRGSEPRQFLPGMGLQLDFKLHMFVFPLSSLIGMKSDEGHRAFTPFWMSAGYDGDLQNIRMGNQLLLNSQAGCVLGRTIN